MGWGGRITPQSSVWEGTAQGCLRKDGPGLRAGTLSRSRHNAVRLADEALP